jgi:4a-hydroxytetrahydrobiopterin dehydratase
MKCALLRRQQLMSRCCTPLAAGNELASAHIAEQLAELPDWQCVDGVLQRQFEFADFHDTIAFVNAIARVAHREDHHPEMRIGYSQCAVRWSTHSVSGISINDFICAAKTDAVYAGELN